MRKMRIFSYFIIFIIIINVIVTVYADDELEETSLTEEEINEILETAAEPGKLPTINARNAIVYDRTSRRNSIWKKRKYKMQNGINNKNNDSNSSSRKC